MSAPLHSRASLYLGKRFFDGVASFCELEAGIAALGTEQERGDAFEVFAEAYLATHPLVAAKIVWPQLTAPQQVTGALHVATLRDMGVDGVYEGYLGAPCAYQVKFRTGRPSLTWEELSTFMGLTEGASERLLFTNCVDLPGVMASRPRFHSVRGTDLDRLEASDFEAVRAFLEGARIERKRKEPRPHQVEAASAIANSFQRNDRATSVMACGTGKTLVGLWVAERMGANRILVLVPSLALLAQTLREWVKETHWKQYAYISVCSDPTVEEAADALAIKPCELDFPVSTEAAILSRFLAHPFGGVKVVFSTYQSSRVVAEGMERGRPFDLAIFDEAHKTAGRANREFGMALQDDAIPIRKRLFLTATPRHYDHTWRNSLGDFRPIYSMDDPSIYGEPVYKLSFLRAATMGIICRYQVIVYVVTSSMVEEEMLQRGDVDVEGETVKARHVANQIALAKAIEKHGVRKVISFHSSIRDAQRFAAHDKGGIASHVSNLAAFHVNGGMTSAIREQAMRQFRSAPLALVSNARCLTEGVDVPAVDMVAFMHPKKSTIEIIQATGRAMRIPEGSSKTTGYILIPIFVQQHKSEALSDALTRTDFGYLWDVLSAIQEQDEVLAEVLRCARETKGRTGIVGGERIAEYVEVLGPSVSLDAIREHVHARTVEELTSTWDERYGRLCSYKEKNGHCNVSFHDWPNLSLAEWVSSQRSSRKRGLLSRERIARLDAIGFQWEVKYGSSPDRVQGSMDGRGLKVKQGKADNA